MRNERNRWDENREIYFEKKRKLVFVLWEGVKQFWGEGVVVNTNSSKGNKFDEIKIQTLLKDSSALTALSKQ